MSNVGLRRCYSVSLRVVVAVTFYFNNCFKAEDAKVAR